MTAGPPALARAVPGGRACGLERWIHWPGPDSVVWVAPGGSTATLQVTGADADPAELQWSARCAEVPATRAVVLLGAPGNGDPAVDFTAAHLLAEDVAEFVGARSGVEAGPIEVLVFRPDADSAPWPEPAATPDGAEFRFPHRGGADVRITLTVPTPTGEA